MWNHWCSILSLNTEEKKVVLNGFLIQIFKWYEYGDFRNKLYNPAILKWVAFPWGTKGRRNVIHWGLYPTGYIWRWNLNLSHFQKWFVSRLMPQTESSKWVLWKEGASMWPPAILTTKTIDLESTHVKCNHKLKEIARVPLLF